MPFDHTIPLPVTDAMLTSNIVEVPPTAWDGVTVFALGSQTSIFSGPNSTLATLYESLQDGNVGKAPASEPLWWKPIGVAYRSYLPNVSYVKGAVVTHAHRLLEKITPGLGHDPATSGPEFWLDTGPSNRWAMFDRQIETQTTHPDTIRVEIPLNGRFDTLGLFEVEAASINVTLMKGELEVYNENYSMTSYTGIGNYWDHFFNPVERKHLLYLTGLPIITGLTLIVTLTGTNVAVGHLGHGRRRRFGETERGAELGFLDYSEYGVDQFGRRTVIIRDYKDEGGFNVFVPATYVDSTRRAIKEVRGIPAIICASERYESMVFLGLITSSKVIVTYAHESVLRVQVEGF